MILFMLKLEPSPLQRKELLGLMFTIIGPTSCQPGCLGCKLFDGAGEDDTVLLLEQWDSEANFHEHVRSPIYSRILVAMELSSIPPEVRCHHVDKSWGMELIGELRHAGNGEANKLGDAGEGRN